MPYQDAAAELDGLSLRSLLERANLGVVIHRWSTEVVYANPAALRLLRLTHEQIIGRDALDPQWQFVDEAGHTLPVAEYPVSRVQRSREPLAQMVIGVCDSSLDGISWFAVNAYAEPGDDVHQGFIIVTFNDIGAFRKRFSRGAILDNTQDIVIVTEAGDLRGPLGPRIVYVNRAFEALTGYSAAEAIGETPRLLQGPGTSADARQRIRAALLARQPVQETLLNYSKSGRPYWLEMSIFPLEDRQGEVTHFAAIERDVTERLHHAQQLESRNRDLKALKRELESTIAQRTEELREANTRLRQLAYKDHLTGLSNRRSFLEQAARQLAHATRHGRTVLTGVIDIDHFKLVNDVHGHEAGDRILQAVGEALKGFFRREDAYGRLGGEEFGFVIEVERAADAPAVAERLRLAMAGLRTDNLRGGPPLTITVSIGLNVGEPGATLELADQLRRADRALFDAKRQGRNRVHLANGGRQPSGEPAGENPRPPDQGQPRSGSGTEDV